MRHGRCTSETRHGSGHACLLKPPQRTIRHPSEVHSRSGSGAGRCTASTAGTLAVGFRVGVLLVSLMDRRSCVRGRAARACSQGGGRVCPVCSGACAHAARCAAHTSRTVCESPSWPAAGYARELWWRRMPVAVYDGDSRHVAVTPPWPLRGASAAVHGGSSPATEAQRDVLRSCGMDRGRGVLHGTGRTAQQREDGTEQAPARQPALPRRITSTQGCGGMPGSSNA